MTFQKLLTALCLLIVVNCFASNDKYRLILTDNPSSTIMIGWNQLSGINPVVYYGAEDFGADWQKYPQRKSVNRVVVYKMMNNHFVKLTNLEPDTAYFFVIKDSEGVSKRFWFKTASAENDRMSFIAGGDSRNNRDVRQNANKLVAKLKPHAIFFGGDMTNLNTSSEWKDWLDDWQLTTAEDGRMFPIVPARGNHEWSNMVIHNLFNTSSRSIYYALTFGKNLLRSYTLNSEITAGGFQSLWLKSDLEKSKDVIWKMAQYHKPMRPHVASKSEGNDEYNNWAKLFYDYKVNLVCESDSHSVKSTWPLKPCSGTENCDEGFERDDKNGTVYVGEGCWGAPLRGSNDKKKWTRNSGVFNQFKLIFVNERKIEVRTVMVEEADTVSPVSNEDVFSLPKDLKIWKPSNGEVVELLSKEEYDNKTPDITFSTVEEEQSIEQNQEIDIAVDVIKEKIPVSVVEFKIDGQTIMQDEEAPFLVSYMFENNGRHKIEAIAYNEDLSAFDTESIEINVGGFSGTMSSQITTSKDDVEEGIDASGDLYFNSSDLEMGYDYAWTIFGTNQYTGLRFQNIAIPKGAIIKSANIQFASKENQSSKVHLNIAAHNVSNAKEFRDNYDVSSRNRLKQIVSWQPKPWRKDEISNNTKTPNLKELLQVLVNKEDWKYGNSVSFSIWDKDFSINRRKAYTFDSDKSKAPKLIISYEFKTSENEQELTSQISSVKVYPNPFKEALTISLPNQFEKLQVIIYTLSGKIVYQKSYAVENKKVKINTEYLVKGEYLVKIINENNNSITKQIIKN